MKPRLFATAIVASLLPEALVAQDAPAPEAGGGPVDLAAFSGDAAAGEQQFARQCVSCHVVQNEAGEVLAGRNARTGPNLWQAVGNRPAHVEGFAYSSAMKAYGESGVLWAEDNLVHYLLDPTAHLREALGDSSARSKMAYKVRDEGQARDIAAYLATFGLPAGEQPGTGG